MTALPIPSDEEVLAALAQMTADQRTEWVALVERASANRSNAAYGFGGNVPQAKPDPETWSATYLWLGLYQLAHAIEQIPTGEG